MQSILKRIILLGTTTLMAILVFNSCSLFDKDIEQDRHITQYRNLMLSTLDSLTNSTDRIGSFQTILDSIETDVALITPRKKNELLKSCYSFISNEYCQLGNFDKSIEYSNKLLQIDGKDSRGFFNRGVAYQGAGKDSLALANYAKAIDLNEKYTSAYYNSAIIYDDANDFNKAIEFYTKSIDQSPLYLSDIYLNRGNIFIRKNEVDNALSDYSSAIKLDTLNLAAYSNRGNIYTNKGQYDDAINDYTRALEIDSTSADAFNKRGYAFELMDDYENALADYRQAIALDLDNALGQTDISKHALSRVKPLMKKQKSSNK